MPNFDFSLLRQLAAEMRRLAAIPQSHKDFAAAQVALEDLRTDYRAMVEDYKTQYGINPANPNRALASPEAKELAGFSDDRGQVTAGVLGGLRGLGGATGAAAGASAGIPLGPFGVAGGGLIGYLAGRQAVPLAAQAGAAVVPGGVSGEDVSKQWEATAKAHDLTSLAGEMAGASVGGLAARLGVAGSATIAKANTARLAARRAALEFEHDFGVKPSAHFWSTLRGGWRRIFGATKAAQGAATKAQVTAATTAPTSSTAVQVSAVGNAAKTEQVAQQVAQSADEQLVALLETAKQQEMAMLLEAKTQALVKAGFSLADAGEMAAAGHSVPKSLLNPILESLRRAAKASTPR